MSPLRELMDDIDEDLFVHLDDEDHLAIPVARRLLEYAEDAVGGTHAVRRA